MQLLADTPALTTLLIVLAGSGGLVGAIIALLKLRPEANQSAVLQAQGAMETMVDLNEQLERALHRANERADHYRRECEEWRHKYERANEQWGPFPVDEEPYDEGSRT